MMLSSNANYNKNIINPKVLNSGLVMFANLLENKMEQEHYLFYSIPSAFIIFYNQ